MLLQKRGARIAVVFACLLSLLPLAGASALSGLTLSPLDPTSVEATWDGDKDHEYKAFFEVTGSNWSYWTSAEGLSATADFLAPGTYYTVTIEDLDTGDTISEEIRTDKADAYRDYSYRWNTCRVYSAHAGEADYFERSKNRVSSITQSTARNFLREGTLSVVVEFWWDKTSYEKEWYALIVLRTPSGNAFTKKTPNEMNGSWNNALCAYHLNELFDEMNTWKANWEKGEYTIELFNDGWFAGRAKFTLK